MARLPNCGNISKMKLKRQTYDYRTLQEIVKLADGRKDPLDGKNVIRETIRSQALKLDFR